MFRRALHALAFVAGLASAACTGDGSTDAGDAIADRSVIDSGGDAISAPIDSAADASDASIDVPPSDTGCTVSMSDYCFDQLPAGGCGDIARTPDCVGGRNTCPPGTVPGTSCDTTPSNPAWCPGVGAATGDPCTLPDGGTETDECRYPTAESGCPSHVRGCRCVSMQFMCSCAF